MATRPNSAQRQKAALLRRAAAETPATTAAQKKALAAARARADVQAAADALRSHDTLTAAKAILSDVSKNRLESDVNVNGIRVMVKGANLTMRNDVPSKYRLEASAMEPSEETVAAVKRIADRLATPFVDGAEEGVLRALTLGVQQGLDPEELARIVRDGIGLSEYDVTLINTFATKLRGDPSAAFDNTLRDGRYDSTLSKAAAGELDLSETQIGTMVDRYAERLLNTRSEAFARTMALTSMKEGTLVAWQEAAQAAEAQMTKTWVTTLDGRERPTHHDMDGATVPIDEPWDVPEAGLEMTPGDGEFNCLTPATRVAAPDRVNVARRIFDGETVTLYTAAGHELTVTPNHPILTPCGWVAASALHEGAQVIHSTAHEWKRGLDVNGQNVPTRIDEITEALFLSSPPSRVRQVVVTAEDFHGDGINGDIAVVVADPLLRLELDAALFEHAPKFTLPMRPREAARLTSHRAANLNLGGINLPPPAVMRRSHKRGALLRRLLRPLQSFRFGLSAERHAILAEQQRDHIPVMSDAPAQVFSALSGQVAPDHIVGVERRPYRVRPDRNVMRAEQLPDRFPGAPDTVAEAYQALPGQVALDYVVRVERRPYRGHVYNLETKRGWYIAEGIVTHNCRCTMVFGVVP